MIDLVVLRNNLFKGSSLLLLHHRKKLSQVFYVLLQLFILDKFRIENELLGYLKVVPRAVFALHFKAQPQELVVEASEDSNITVTLSEYPLDYASLRQQVL